MDIVWHLCLIGQPINPNLSCGMLKQWTKPPFFGQKLKQEFLMGFILISFKKSNWKNEIKRKDLISSNYLNSINK